MAHSMLRHKDNGPSPSGKAQDFDSCTRWFESSWPSYGRVAQVVEHLTFNQVVRGSNPRTLTHLVPWSSVGLKKCGCGGTGRRARLRIQSLRGAGSSPVIRIQLNITKSIIYRSNRGTFTQKGFFFLQELPKELPMKKGTACRRCALARRRRKEEAVFRFLC